MTGWPPGLLQDDCRKLSKWLAGKPDARYIARKNIDMTDKKDPHAELMRMIQALEISAARDGRDEHPTDRTQQAYECVNAFARTLTDRIAELEAELARPETTAVSLMRAELHNSIDRTERAERMFYAACADLGAINQALGLDPDDGGAEPIIDAIKEMQSCGMVCQKGREVDEQYASRLVPATPEAGNGLSVHTGMDGVWLCFKSRSGKSAMLQPAVHILPQNKGIVYSAINEWINDRQQEFEAGHTHTALAAQPAPAVVGPVTHSELDAIALERYKVVATTGGFWPFAVVAGTGAAHLYVGQRKTCEQVARRLAGAFLDGAFTATHPAQAEQPAPAVAQAALAAKDVDISALTAERDALKVDAARYRWLRVSTDCDVYVYSGSEFRNESLQRESLDAYTDAAIAKEKAK